MEPKKKLLTLAFIFGGAIFLWMFFMIYPIFGFLQKNIEKSTEQLLKLSVLERKKSNLITFKNVLDEKAEEMAKLDGMFLEIENPVPFIEFLERLAFSAGLEMNITPVNETSFNITLKGSFPNFMKFLSKVESGPYLLTEKSLTLKRITSEDIKKEKESQVSVGDITATLIIQAFKKE